MLFAEVAQKLGKIDVLFINVGIAKFGPIETVTEQQYDEQFDVNMKGSFFTIQKALPHLNDGASIILNTSVASHKGRPSGSVYAATKAAMRSLTRSAAAALVGRNIRVNAVAPDRFAQRYSIGQGCPKKLSRVFWTLSSPMCR
jgi:NAD(P)-dependent dehydrogenase (short-subunit alcohol dehydrogenase family)